MTNKLSKFWGKDEKVQYPQRVAVSLKIEYQGINPKTLLNALIHLK